MSEPIDQEREKRARKHAAVVLGGLAVVAAVVALVFVVFVPHGGNTTAGGPTIVDRPRSTPPTSSPRDTSPSTPGPGSTSPGATGSAPGSSSSAPGSPSGSGSGSGLPRGATSCPSSAPCALPGDAGQVVAAINRYRAEKGRKPVTGKVTAGVQQCALQQGNVPPCPDSYFWEPVTQANGDAVVAKIASKGEGQQWLLDPSLTTLGIGWAYNAGQYSCAVVKAG